ncbi:MAG: glycosyltransferase family 4 protein [Bacteroidales bacterium]|jgi:glycosyltransferase involved in cell wall biosynthesis|nr:glycosyltransferase family 4 protein [Bacteroidales bacterium]
MKVLHVINSLEGGGAEKLLTEILPLLKQQGCETELLLLSDNNNVFKVEDIPTFVIGGNIYSVFNIFKVRKYLKRGYDIIHVHLFPAQYFIAFASFLFRHNSKIVFTEHSNNNRRWNKWVFKGIEKFVYRRYDRIIAITDAVKSNILAWVGSESVDIEVINNGVDLKRFEQPVYQIRDISNRLSEEDIILMMTSSFSEAKDHNTVIRALCHLPSKYKLVLVGEGKMRSEIEALVNDLKVNGRVLFLGFRDDAERLMKSVDINIQSSHWEGFSGVALEAMAAGIPFIGSDVDGIKDVVAGHGILFQQGDDKELASKILALIDDEAYYQRVVRDCQLRAQDFSIDVMVDSLQLLYKSLIR